MLDRVSLFLVGVQRGGTTTLFTYLSSHPELRAPRHKETHFFDNERLPWPNVDYDEFHAFYDPDASGRPFEATPVTIFWPPALPRIVAYNPGARFMLLLRDPIERAWSHWRLERSRNAEDLPFASAIREGRDRLMTLPELHPKRRVYSYVERGFYGAQVHRLLDLVPRRNVLFLRSADLYRNPAQTLASVANFAGIGSFPGTAPVWDNASTVDESAPPEEDVTYLRSLYRRDCLELEQLTDLDLRDWLTVRDS